MPQPPSTTYLVVKHVVFYRGVQQAEHSQAAQPMYGEQRSPEGEAHKCSAAAEACHFSTLQRSPTLTPACRPLRPPPPPSRAPSQSARSRPHLQLGMQCISYCSLQPAVVMQHATGHARAIMSSLHRSSRLAGCWNMQQLRMCALQG